MATDYDAPRNAADGLNEDSLEELKATQLKQKDNVTYDPDEDQEDVGTLPGGDLSDQELSVQVVPKQADEFTCSNCFLVHHRSQLSETLQDPPVCRDCATRMNRKASQVGRKGPSAAKADARR
jgi:hypothetical protein